LTHINAGVTLASQDRAITFAKARSRSQREAAVLAFEDCLGLCQLSEEEIRAIAEHEHLPQIVALELGSLPDALPRRRAPGEPHADR